MDEDDSTTKTVLEVVTDEDESRMKTILEIAMKELKDSPMAEFVFNKAAVGGLNSLDIVINPPRSTVDFSLPPEVLHVTAEYRGRISEYENFLRDLNNTEKHSAKRKVKLTLRKNKQKAQKKARRANRK